MLSGIPDRGLRSGGPTEPARARRYTWVRG